MLKMDKLTSHKVVRKVISKDNEIRGYQNIYLNIYSPDDMILVFLTLRNSVRNAISSCENDKNVWNMMICGKKCGNIEGGRKIECFGCMLLERFSPCGMKSNFDFSVKIQKNLRFVCRTMKSDMEGYKRISPPNVDDLDKDFIHTHYHYICDNPEEHKLFISMIMDDDEIPQNIYAYKCDDSVNMINRVYNYGNGLDILSKNDFTSELRDGIRYLKDEIVEGIIFQLHHALSILSPHCYTHGDHNVENLAFSDEICSTYNSSYSFRIHILSSYGDTIVRDGAIYYYRPPDYGTQLSGIKESENLAKFHRKHSGWNVDPGKADFAGFLNSLRNCEIFERSLKSKPEILDMVEDPDVWEKMESELP